MKLPNIENSIAMRLSLTHNFISQEILIREKFNPIKWGNLLKSYILFASIIDWRRA